MGRRRSMSNVKNTGFKKMKCTDMHHQEKTIISDVGAGFVSLQVVGTDVNVSGVKTGASITVLTGDYSPGVDANGDACNNPDGTFLICIETEGVFYVTLFDGSDFIITAVQAAAYLGQWYPAKLISVNVGTTGDFSVGY
jgi:hypothetical protein